MKNNVQKHTDMKTNTTDINIYALKRYLIFFLIFFPYRNGSNIKGYFAWSFIDALELLDGYKSSFGLYYVDRNDPELTRYPKLSAKWYSQFLKGTRSSLVGAIEFKNDSSLVSVGHLFQ
jgi:hypothetical protein